MNIYVFKTSISANDIGLINTILRLIIPECFWNYDLEDCDKILRIKSKKDISQVVCAHLKMEGFAIEELE